MRSETERFYVDYLEQDMELAGSIPKVLQSFLLRVQCHSGSLDNLQELTRLIKPPATGDRICIADHDLFAISELCKRFPKDSRIEQWLESVQKYLGFHNVLVSMSDDHPGWIVAGTACMLFLI
jgi:hypothetical protein